MAEELSRAIAAAARELRGEIGSQHTLERGLKLAIDLIDGAEHAGVSLMHRGRLDSPACSADVVRLVDELQQRHGEGPCVDAILEEEAVHSADLATDERWPRWGPETARETGFRSMMSFRMFTAQDRVGALTLYSAEPGAFGPDDLEQGLSLAAHLALAYVAAHEIEHLHVALDTRLVIGKAVGILMERFDLDEDRAWEVLKRVSQDSNRKLRDVARELVLTRTLPMPPNVERP
jgi:GAF domain-containing protein